MSLSSPCNRVFDERVVESVHRRPAVIDKVAVVLINRIQLYRLVDGNGAVGFNEYRGGQRSDFTSSVEDSQPFASVTFSRYVMLTRLPGLFTFGSAMFGLLRWVAGDQE